MEKVKVLVNAATLLTGGGIQVGISFIEHAIEAREYSIDFLYIVSRQIYDELPTDLQNDKKIVLCEISPAKIIEGKKSRKMIKAIEKEFAPLIVFSIGFPSYIRFSTIEIGRYTNPWEINAPPLPWFLYSLKERIKIFMGVKYRLFWAAKADYFMTQTQAAKDGIIKKLGVPPDKVKVIPNCPNPIFLQAPIRKHSINNKPVIFCLSAPHRHKNLTIIPLVAAALINDYNIECSFVLTIGQKSWVSETINNKAAGLNVEKCIKDIGKIKLKDCIDWYNKADILFLPTLLEVFSATHVEAMAMEKPIVTTDLDFARDVCGEAAHYYQPRSANDAAKKIMEVITNDQLRNKLISEGKKQLKTFPTPKEKHNLIFDWFIDIIKNKPIHA